MEHWRICQAHPAHVCLPADFEGRDHYIACPATGAGKSSLINCVFRLMELDAGRITIDGLDISRLGVHQLRSRMAIIPQVQPSYLNINRCVLHMRHRVARMHIASRRAPAALLHGHPPGALCSLVSHIFMLAAWRRFTQGIILDLPLAVSGRCRRHKWTPKVWTC